MLMARAREHDLEDFAKKSRLRPEERRIAFARGHDRTLRELIKRHHLSREERAIALVRSNFRLDFDHKLGNFDNLSPEERRFILLRGTDRHIGDLVERGNLTPEERRLAVIRGNQYAWEKLAENGYLDEASPEERRLVFARCDDNVLNQLIQSGPLSPEERSLAFARGDDEALSKLVGLGDLSPEERSLAFLCGEALTLSRLVRQGNLNPEEVRAAIYRGGYSTFVALTESIDSLAPPERDLFGAILQARFGFLHGREILLEGCLPKHHQGHKWANDLGLYTLPA